MESFLLDDDFTKKVREEFLEEIEQKIKKIQL